MRLIEEHLTESLGDNVTLKHKSIIKSIIMLIVGVGIIVATTTVPELSEGFINSTLIFFGGMFALIGLLMCISAIFNKDYYYIPERSKLQKKVEFFELSEENALKEFIEKKDVDSFGKFKHSKTPTLQVIMYKTTKGTIVAAQLQKYVPYAYQPVTDIVVMK